MREWFNKQAGEAPMQEQGDGSVMTLLGDGTPNVVRLPSALGGNVVAVVEVGTHSCPKCLDTKHKTLLLDAVLPGRGQVAVVECPVTGEFLWVAIPTAQEDPSISP